MLARFERYDARRGSRRAVSVLRAVLSVIALSFLMVLLISTVFGSSYLVESESMIPTLEDGDRILASHLTYGAQLPYLDRRLPGLRSPRRGDLVIVVPPFYQYKGFITLVVEPVVRFFTLQKATLIRFTDGSRRNNFLVKRIVALPGDAIRMQDFVAYIRPRDRSEFISEYDLMPEHEMMTQIMIPEGDMRDRLSFLGDFEERVLGDDEYFLLGDNRPQSSDSRYWGPVQEHRIIGRVILRYWPMDRLSRL